MLRDMKKIAEDAAINLSEKTGMLWESYEVSANEYAILFENIQPHDLEQILNKLKISLPIKWFEDNEIMYAVIVDLPTINALANSQFPSPSSSTSPCPPGVKNSTQFLLSRELLAKEAGRFSHSINLATKIIKPGDDPKKSTYQTIWFRKYERNPTIAKREVIAQELFRLLIPGHPKTRLEIEKDQKHYVSSKRIPDAELLEGIDLKELHDGLLKGEISGLAAVMIVSLLLNERDLKLGNMLINQSKQIFKIDGDWCFAALRLDENKRKNFDITAKTLNYLPLNSDYHAFNWMDAIQENVINVKPTCLSPAVGFTKEFLYESHKTILNILLLPSVLLLKLMHHWIVDENEINLLFNFLIERRQRLCVAAFENKKFRDFLTNDKSIPDLIKEFQIYLSELALTGKTKWVDNPNEINTAMMNNLNDLLEVNRSLPQVLSYDYVANKTIFVRPKSNDEKMITDMQTSSETFRKLK